MVHLLAEDVAVVGADCAGADVFPTDTSTRWRNDEFTRDRLLTDPGLCGVGKTGLAMGLLLKALQNGYRGAFVKAQDLCDEMYASLADRSSRALLRRLAPLTPWSSTSWAIGTCVPSRPIFFKLMEEGYRRHPTIISTNLDYDQRTALLGQEEVTAARSRACDSTATPSASTARRSAIPRTEAVLVSDS